MASSHERRLTVGDVARLVRLSTRTIHYYESRGLLGRQKRNASGYRIYSDADVQRLRYIRGLRQLLRYPIAEVERVLAEEDELKAEMVRGHPSPEHLLDLLDRLAGSLTRQLEQTNVRLERLMTLRPRVEGCLCDLRGCLRDVDARGMHGHRSAGEPRQADGHRDRDVDPAFRSSHHM